MVFHFFLILNLPLFILPLEMVWLTSADGTFQGAKPDCPTHCGNVPVPYPFGIGEGCYFHTPNDTFSPFSLVCNSSYKTPKLSIPDYFNMTYTEVYNISVSELRTFTSVYYKCYLGYGDVEEGESEGRIRSPSMMPFSGKNKFTVIGCDYSIGITDFKNPFGYLSCEPNCFDASDVRYGCCQTSKTTGSVNFYPKLGNHTDVGSFNNCVYTFLADKDSFQCSSARDLVNASDLVKRIESTVTVVHNWVINPYESCSTVTECKGNTSCEDVDLDTSSNIPAGGYRCICEEGYEGNPYLEPGCQDINECDSKNNLCYGDCINTRGSYNCTCPKGTVGDPKIPKGCVGENSKFHLTIFIIALVLGLLAIFSSITGIFFGMKRRKLMKLREKFFEQNGGVLLKQKMKSQGSHEGMSLFTTEELKKATDNYSQKQIVGRGAYGVVYKGILSDKRVVAIKKSKLVDRTQAEQFINEVMILTQVIHRNVVTLLGCCLEEEVPILVYEFISNNTLFHHIHHRLGGMSWLTWENRLRIAIEAASALAYLHSETIMPIVHRDVKSSNILLDDNYTTKISDFGASRLVPVDHDQVTTLIQGTLGYLDPEYYHTSQLTNKSDVYSFGVVLAELLTGKKPIGVDRINEEKNLATYFLKSMEANCLFEIIEPRLLREGTLTQLEAIGQLVKRCLNLHGHYRPTMKEVAIELEGLKKFTTHPSVQQQTCAETHSSVLEIDQSDLYDVPLVSYSTTDSEFYSYNTRMGF